MRGGKWKGRGRKGRGGKEKRREDETIKGDLSPPTNAPELRCGQTECRIFPRYVHVKNLSILFVTLTLNWYHRQDFLRLGTKHSRIAACGNVRISAKPTALCMAVAEVVYPKVFPYSIDCDRCIRVMPSIKRWKKRCCPTQPTATTTSPLTVAISARRSPNGNTNTDSRLSQSSEAIALYTVRLWCRRLTTRARPSATCLWLAGTDSI